MVVRTLTLNILAKDGYALIVDTLDPAQALAVWTLGAEAGMASQLERVTYDPTYHPGSPFQATNVVVAVVDYCYHVYAPGTYVPASVAERASYLQASPQRDVLEETREWIRKHSQASGSKEDQE